MYSKIFIFHGTGGHPEENWFPWLKGELESKGYRVFVPQFPSPVDNPSKIDEWFAILKKYEDGIDENTILIGHSLGGIFALRVLEKLTHPIKTAIFVGTPIGIDTIVNFEKDKMFSGFHFDWPKIKQNAKNFVVYHSDNDPYVSLGNGEELAKHLGVELTFIPNAGHFITAAGYTTFPHLLQKVLAIG